MALSLMTVPLLSARISPSALFSDHMVLQRDAPVPVWGTAVPGAEVVVRFGSQSHRVKAGSQGNWFATLAPMPGSFDSKELLIECPTAPEESISIKDVLVGEVWVAAGQSNMAYGVSTALNAAAEIAAANHPGIRAFQMTATVAHEPQRTMLGRWVVCNPTSAGKISATGYFFARDLQQVLNVPIGLLQNAESGTPAEAWMSQAALESDPDFQPILGRHDAAVAAYRNPTSPASAGLTPGNPESPTALPPDPAVQTSRPAGLFNGHVAPLVPYAVRGVIWWQGEYNSERGEQYRKLFPALIRDWRTQWKNPSLPFLFVQLQNLDIQPQPNPAHYDELREAQLMTLRNVPFTGMAVACDVGDPKDIHPPNKQAVGRRLALLARNLVYGESDLVGSGPIFRSFTIKNSSIHIAFDHVGGGLALKNAEGLTGFEIAGKDRQFVPAEAMIEQSTVIVSSPQVLQPFAVRYAWKDNPICTLYNAEGLPASPFRTDDWPVETTGIR